MNFLERKTPIINIIKPQVLKFKLWRKNQLTKYGKPPSLSTINAELRLLRAAWNKAVEMEITNLPNPCKQKGLIEREKNERTRILTQEEEEKIMEYFEKHPELQEMKVAYLLSRYTGASRGEIIDLKVKDLDLTNRNITFYRRKTRKIRTIPLIPVLCEELKKYLAQNPFSDGSPLLPNLTPNKITDTFRRIVRKLGIKSLCFHDLRRTCIKELAIVEPNLYVLKEITGHSDIQVLSHYIPVGEEDKIRIMEKFAKRSFTLKKTNGS